MNQQNDVNGQTNVNGQDGYGQGVNQQNSHSQAGYGQNAQTGYGQTAQNSYSQNIYSQTGYGQTTQNSYSQNSYSQTGYGQTTQNGYSQTGYGQTNQNGYSQISYGQTGQNSYNQNGYGQTGNRQNANAYYTGQYNGFNGQQPNNPARQRGGISDIIFAIFGLIANLLLLIATFVPVLQQKTYNGAKKNMFVWSFCKQIGKMLKHLKYDNFFTMVLMVLVVAMLVLIAILSFVFLFVLLADIIGRKKVSRHLTTNFCVILTMFFVEYISLKSLVFVKIKSPSAVMMVIALSILAFSCIFSGYIGNMSLAKQSAGTYHTQFVFNLLTGIFSGIIVILAFSDIMKPKYGGGSAKYSVGTFIGGFINTLTDIIRSIDKRYYDSLAEVKSDCKTLSLCLIIALMALAVISYQIKNLKDSVKNINIYFNAGARILVRSVCSIALVIAMQIVIAVNHKTFGAKKTPGTFFVIVLVFAILNIMVIVVKKILEVAVPKTCVELVPGTKSKLRKKTIACIVLNTISIVLLTGIFVVSSFAYHFIEKKAKEKINDIYDGYYNEYKDYMDEFDEYKDYMDDYSDYIDDYDDWD